jgi:penicillin-binding protein A
VPPDAVAPLSKRIRWLGLFILLCFVAVFVQLNNLQVVQAHKYATASDNPAYIASLNSEPRGDITSAEGTILAESVKAPAGSTYTYGRLYPTGSLFGQITGVFSHQYGLYGVEASYNSYLTAHNAPVKTLRDLFTTTTTTDTVRLTLSDSLQSDARQALAGRDGSVVVLDPATGAIEAMYSNPSYDPSPLASQACAVTQKVNGTSQCQQTVETQAWLADTTVPDSLGHVPFTSLAYQDIAFPGSSFKIVTTAATYEKAPQLVSTPMPGYSCIPPHTFGGQTTNLCNFGDEFCGGDIAEMLPPSCDTGYAQLGARVGAANMTAEADAFGFNSQPPIDLPHSLNEVSQFLQPSCYQNAQVFLAFSSIGQDCTKATPLQMAMVAGAVADNGTVMSPHVMADIHDTQGNLIKFYKPSAWLQAMTPVAAAAINQLMVGVTHESNGTAYGIFPAAEDVAAKTGTAQVENAAGQYIATNDWMIAFAPASAPKVAVAVELLDQPVSGTGAAEAGPVLKTIIADALSAGP